MTAYVLIESRDPFESRDPEFVEQTAIAIKERGHPVTVFLVQNGVFAARRQPGCLRRLAQAGVTLLADDFSLRERGIAADRLADGVKATPLDVVIDAMADGRKVIWY